MRKIHEHNSVYSTLKIHVIDPSTRFSFRRLEMLGTENIPKDGAIILAPNHCNTLMDALVVLQSRKGPTVFGARADIFNSPVLAKIMTFLRILPMVRERDGIRNVIRNKETMEVISEVLRDRVPYCVFCEGTHRPKHSLLPIKKGIFRTAFTAIQSGASDTVKIVPVGLDYSDFFRFRGKCVMEFGSPLDVGSYIDKTEENIPAETYRELSKELSSRISELITFIPDDELYDGKWALVRILGADVQGKMSVIKKMNRWNAAAIERVLEKEPEKMKKLLDEAKEFDTERHERRISIYSFCHKAPGIAARSLLWLISLPLYLVCAVLSMPIWLTATVICSKMKDRAFHNSVRMLVKMVLTPFTLIIWAILFFCTIKWYAALVLCLLFLPGCRIFYDYREFSRILLSDWKLTISGKGLKSRFAAIKESFLELI